MSPSLVIAAALFGAACSGSGAHDPDCISQYECTQPTDGTVVFCLGGKCTSACSTPYFFSDWACVDGVTRLCSSLATPPCDQCAYPSCPSETYCSYDDHACHAMQPPGGACTEDIMCSSSRCIGGTTGGVCSLPLGAPCVAGDPCPECLEGFCTEECVGTFDNVLCWVGACSEGYLPVHSSASGAGHCHRQCDSNPNTCETGQSCVIPPDYFSTTTIRICAWSL